MNLSRIYTIINKNIKSFNENINTLNKNIYIFDELFCKNDEIYELYIDELCYKNDEIIFVNE